MWCFIQPSDDDLNLAQRIEEHAVSHLILKPGVEALNIAVLQGFGQTGAVQVASSLRSLDCSGKPLDKPVVVTLVTPKCAVVLSKGKG